MNLSDEYLEELKKLHSKKTFGLAAGIPKEVELLIKTKNIKSILDFGCGKGNTSAALKKAYPDITVYSYDPVTSPIELPAHVDLVYSSDVLEHVEPELLKSTLDNLFAISTYQYHLIACHPAKKSLSDGRNAHLIIENSAWWKSKIEECFNDNWKMLSYETNMRRGKTKKLGTLEQEKFIVVVERI